MYQEQEYIIAKLEILNRSKSSEEASLTDLIVRSQQKMREYAFEQLQALQTVKLRVAKLCARSSVSQRDIQRVFTFYQWLMKFYSKFDPHKEQREKYHRRAMMVSLGIVYYMRLNSKYRKEYRQYLDDFPHLFGEITFSQAIEDELQWFIEHVELPPNIAKTEALKENVFVTIACAVTHTPLIIVGDPGSSKTLSFNIAIANLKGKESRIEEFQDTDIFQSLDPHFYQCSRRTTSNEVAKVFIRAINRQQSLAKIPLPISCVVFMDEAGLPEEKLESLKVLHYYLDKQEVSFVAISNHVLDAAKTNRAVSLFRPKAREEELRELARENIVPAGQPQSELHTEQVRSFCRSYKTVVSDSRFQSLFGLRDFIHFVTYLRCKRKELLSHQLVLEALERNFNGTNEFKELCHIFKV
jgi:hemicentin